MGDKTAIQWTDSTWNPVRGCSRVSPGCEHCYAERQAARFSGRGLPYHGLVRMGTRGARWTGRLERVGARHLLAPVRWQKPRRIFVNSMSDLFHERLGNTEIADVFAVMAYAAHHRFQVLTKRARRMREWFEWVARDVGVIHDAARRVFGCDDIAVVPTQRHGMVPGQWPLPNVWLGVSVEDQRYADERIPELLDVPAAVRFVSYEPALGPVQFTNRWLLGHRMPIHEGGDWESASPTLDWIIVGGESGPGARPFDVAWARSVIEQCREAGTACFVKQLGRKILGASDGFRLVRRWLLDGPDHEWVPPLIGPRAYTRPDNAVGFVLYDSHGGDWDEWPADLRVREFPDSGLRTARAILSPTSNGGPRRALSEQAP